jgi:hypothetical protein
MVMVPIAEAPTSSVVMPPGAALPMTRLLQYQVLLILSQSILGRVQLFA